MKVKSQRDLDLIQGRIQGRHESSGPDSISTAVYEDVATLFSHIAALHCFLEEHSDQDAFGTEGWEHAIGRPE